MLTGQERLVLPVPFTALQLHRSIALHSSEFSLQMSCRMREKQVQVGIHFVKKRSIDLRLIHQTIISAQIFPRFHAVKRECLLFETTICTEDIHPEKILVHL
jgi:hypothetical protein